METKTLLILIIAIQIFHLTLTLAGIGFMLGVTHTFSIKLGEIAAWIKLPTFPQTTHKTEKDIPVN